jgi:hypothetical protein
LHRDPNITFSAGSLGYGYCHVLAVPGSTQCHRHPSSPLSPAPCLLYGRTTALSRPRPDFVTTDFTVVVCRAYDPPQSYRRPPPRPRLVLTPLDAASSLHPWLQVEAVCLRHPSVRAAARCCCFTLSAHCCYQLCLSPICLVSYFVLPALFIFIERKLHTVSVTFKTWL